MRNIYSRTVIRRLLFSVCFIFYFLFFSSAQTDSSHIRISLLTCSPGEDLYSTFGHSALRITDSVSQDDIVYNYGTFDFSEPGFYMKFIRGKLLYYLSTEDFDSFSSYYLQESREITEQVLNLSSTEKIKIKKLLLQNLESSNRFYKYDFTFDNCTTRLRDLVEKTADTAIAYQSILDTKKSFRDLIHVYLDKNDMQWSKLGIDLLLGSKLDALMTTRQVMFLPDYLEKTFDHTKIGNTLLISSSKKLFAFAVEVKETNLFESPLFVFSILFLLILFLSFSKNIFAQRFIAGFDGILFFITGLLGALFIFMWVGTDHIMCKNNYNLIWALPTNLIAAFYINSARQRAKIYFFTIAIINSLLLLSWFFLPQQFNISLVPIIMLLIFRSVINANKKLIPTHT